MLSSLQPGREQIVGWGIESFDCNLNNSSNYCTRYQTENNHKFTEQPK